MVSTVRTAFAAFSLAWTTSVSADDALIAQLQLGMSFGGHKPAMTAALGSSYLVEALSRYEHGLAPVPVTGISYDFHHGFAPSILGARLATSADAEGGGGGSWAWWAAAGLGLAAAAAAASGSDSKETVNGGADNETTCGIAGEGGLLPVIDLNCWP